MNIIRQYKLYKLGIDIPTNVADSIIFMEILLNMLVQVKVERFSDIVFLVDKDVKNQVYMQINLSYGKWHILCHKNGFIQTMMDSYSLTKKTVAEIVMLVANRKFSKIFDVMVFAYFNNPTEKSTYSVWITPEKEIFKLCELKNL